MIVLYLYLLLGITIFAALFIPLVRIVKTARPGTRTSLILARFAAGIIMGTIVGLVVSLAVFFISPGSRDGDDTVFVNKCLQTAKGDPVYPRRKRTICVRLASIEVSERSFLLDRSKKWGLIAAAPGSWIVPIYWMAKSPKKPKTHSRKSA